MRGQYGQAPSEVVERLRGLALVFPAAAVLEDVAAGADRRDSIGPPGCHHPQPLIRGHPAQLLDTERHRNLKRDQQDIRLSGTGRGHHGHPLAHRAAMPAITGIRKTASSSAPALSPLLRGLTADHPG